MQLYGILIYALYTSLLVNDTGKAHIVLNFATGNSQYVSILRLVGTRVCFVRLYES